MLARSISRAAFRGVRSFQASATRMAEEGAAAANTAEAVSLTFSLPHESM
jgi:hypothetical protein